MDKLLSKLVKKTLLRPQVGTELKYSGGRRPWKNSGQVDAISVTSFDSQNFASNLPGQNNNPNVPPENVDYMVLENEDFLISENDDNIII